MTIKPKLLAPAPWEDEAKDTNIRDGAYHVVTDANGKILFDTCNSDVTELHEEHDEDGAHYWDEAGRINLGFAAMARNAFEVMMRRHWWSVEFSCDESGAKAWHVSSYCVPVHGEMRKFVASQICVDPFTALLEADKFMKEIEAKAI